MTAALSLPSLRSISIGFLGLVLSLGLFSAISVHQAQASSGLTDQQAQAILNLLQSFGANQSVINEVAGDLGTTPVQASTPSTTTTTTSNTTPTTNSVTPQTSVTTTIQTSTSGSSVAASPSTSVSTTPLISIASATVAPGGAVTVTESNPTSQQLGLELFTSSGSPILQSGVQPSTFFADSVGGSQPSQKTVTFVMPTQPGAYKFSLTTFGQIAASSGGDSWFGFATVATSPTITVTSPAATTVNTALAVTPQVSAPVSLTWALTNTPGGFYSIASDASGQHLAAATGALTANNGFIYISSNGGATWTQTSAPSVHWLNIASDPTGQFLAASEFDSTANYFVWTSSNGGATWTKSSTPSEGELLETSSNGPLVLGQQQFGVTGSAPNHLYVSLDHGATWTLMSAPAPTVNGVSYNVAAISSNGQRIVEGIGSSFSGGSSINFSSDGGNTWTKSTSAPSTAPWSSMACDSTCQDVITGTTQSGTQGVFISKDGGATWAQVTAIPAGSWHVASDASGQNLIAAGTGVIYTSSNGGTTWTQVTEPGNMPSAAATSDSTGQHPTVLFYSNGSTALYAGSASGSAPVTAAPTTNTVTPQVTTQTVTQPATQPTTPTVTQTTAPTQTQTTSVSTNTQTSNTSNTSNTSSTAVTTTPTPTVSTNTATTQTSSTQTAPTTVTTTATPTVATVQTPKVIVLTSGTSFTVPSDWNSSNNTVEVIGAGGSGSASSLWNRCGAGGGAYSAATNIALTPGASISYQIGVGGAGVANYTFGKTGGDTWFNGSSISSASVSAQGGTGGTTAPGTGGQASSGIGSVKFSGGNGAPGGGNCFSAQQTGGGGAAGPHGNGNPGSGMNGGSGDNGFGGAGGIGATATPATSGSEWVSAGIGGGGGYGNSRGGQYGGGSGGSDSTNSATGGNGLIVITYTPASVSVSGSSMLTASLGMLDFIDNSFAPNDLGQAAATVLSAPFQILTDGLTDYLFAIGVR